MRSGGDAGTAIHTPVPFGIAGIMASISTAEDIGGRRRHGRREAPGCSPGANSGTHLGGGMPSRYVSRASDA
jgi:hypothetical protein